jgi:hypothetical protein
MAAKHTHYWRVFLPKSTYEGLLAEAQLCGLDWCSFKERVDAEEWPHAKWLVGPDKIRVSAMANLLLGPDTLMEAVTALEEAPVPFTGRTNGRLWAAIPMPPEVSDASVRKARAFKVKVDDLRYALLLNTLINAVKGL